MSTEPAVTRIGPGVFRVDVDGRAEIVYAAGPPNDQWLFWNGRVFHQPFAAEQSIGRGRGLSDAHQSLSAPMPATVLKVLAHPGAAVKKGETLLILEAMKMELPVRSASDGVVAAVRCREGELVQPGTLLIELA